MKEIKKIRKRQKGITLIALIVTIIVLIILAGVAISMLTGNNSILNNGAEARDETQKATATEMLTIKITGIEMQSYATNKRMPTVKELADALCEDPNDEIQYVERESQNTATLEKKIQETDTCFYTKLRKYPYEFKINDKLQIETIDGVKPGSGTQSGGGTESGGGTQGGGETGGSGTGGSESDTPTTVQPKASSYTKVGTTYCNSPDLSGFNPENTYYVTYDANGNTETLYGRLDRVEAPDDWYDYGKKIWANVVTVTMDENYTQKITYWTWIPRFMYKTHADDANIADKTVEIAYVNKDNECTVEGEETPFNVTGYNLSDAFKFDETKLNGYWISKYEVQDDVTSTEEIYADSTTNSITVTTTSPSGTYKLFVNGESKNVTLPYTIENLNKNTEYELFLYNQTSGKIIGGINVKTKNDTQIEVDLSGFDLAHTYYVLYDADGTNERKSTETIQVDANGNGVIPSEGTWYDYENKIWANVVTINNNQTTYWTYIPRYEYKVYNKAKYVDIRYISTTDTQSSGYKIPESFTFDSKNLKGYWVSKYEVQD